MFLKMLKKCLMLLAKTLNKIRKVFKMIRQSDVEVEYDYPLDILTITVKDDFSFKRSVELEYGIILDFDENNTPVSIEILDISERLGIGKQEMKNSTASMQITINSDIISVNVKFKNIVHEKEFNESIHSIIANNHNFSNMELVLE